MGLWQLSHKPGRRINVLEQAHHAAAEEDDEDNAADGLGAAFGMADHEAALWAAALSGDARTVGRLLRRHRLPADMLHPRTSSTLLLDVAAVRTLSAQHDEALARVMAVLVRHRASVVRRHFPGNNTAMHLLAAQPFDARVHHRVMFLLDRLHADPRRVSVLMMRNAPAPGEQRGQLPAELAVTAGRRDLEALLRVRQALILRDAHRGRSSTDV